MVRQVDIKYRMVRLSGAQGAVGGELLRWSVEYEVEDVFEHRENYLADFVIAPFSFRVGAESGFPTVPEIVADNDDNSAEAIQKVATSPSLPQPARQAVLEFDVAQAGPVADVYWDVVVPALAHVGGAAVDEFVIEYRWFEVREILYRGLH